MDHGTLPVTKRGYRVEQHAVGHGRAGAARQRPGDHHADEAVDHGIVTTADGSDTMISVRDITDNDGADTLSADLFRPVYGEENPTLFERLGTFFARAAPNRGRTIPGIPGSSLAGSLAWMTITGTVAGRPRTPVPR